MGQAAADVEFTGKQATAVLQIIAGTHGDDVRAVRAAALGERAESMVADQFNGADVEPAVLKDIRPVAVEAGSGGFVPEHQPIDRHQTVLVHESVARSPE